MNKFFFDDDKRVNMGNKKQLTKEELLAKNKQERRERGIERQKTETVTLIQKFMRAYLANKKMVNQILQSPNLQLKKTIMGLDLTAQKVPAKKDEIFVKGLQKFQKYLVTGLNSLVLSLGWAGADPHNLERKN